MADNLAELFETGVSVHMDHMRSLIAFTQARDVEELGALLTRTHELGGAIAALEFNVPEDIYHAMHAEACERLESEARV
jgi:hypothetical protein